MSLTKDRKSELIGEFKRGNADTGSAEVQIALRWNGDGASCAHALALKLESDAGYLPKRRLTTNASGTGNFAVEAQGLSPGDLIAVKINTEHYTAIGKIILEVV